MLVCLLMNFKSISVVVPAYNEEENIGHCIEGLLNQTVPPNKIIIVDNNSKDSTAKIVSNYPVKLIRESKQGLTPARNRGFNEANTDLIAKTDADSRPQSDWVEKLLRGFEKPNTVGVGGTVSFFGTSNPKFKTGLQNLLYFKLSKAILKHEVLNGPNYALTKDVWLKVKSSICLLDSEVHEDLDISMHIAKYGDIFLDRDNVMPISGRRFNNNPKSIYVDYPLRMYRTLFIQKHQWD